MKFKEGKKFTKSDLKNGDIVTYRNGIRRIVEGESLVNQKGDFMLELDNYNENLKDRYKDTDFDIIKVERKKYTTIFERNKEILDEVEKEYLGNIIKPFRDKVKSISKEAYAGSGYFISIAVDYEFIDLPYFENKNMYKNMKINKKYSLEELDL